MILASLSVFADVSIVIGRSSSVFVMESSVETCFLQVRASAVSVMAVVVAALIRFGECLCLIVSASVLFYLFAGSVVDGMGRRGPLLCTVSSAEQDEDELRLRWRLSSLF